MSEVKVPELGESIVEATIGSWLKNVGDSVEAGEALVELETDKVNVEVIADEAGVLSTINKQVGDSVGIGETIAVIGAAGSAPAQSPAPAAQAPAPAAAPAQAAVTQAQAAATPAVQAQASSAPVPAKAAPASVDSNLPLRATPAIRRAALEFGINLDSVTGTGENGRIEMKDLLAHVMKNAAPAPAQVAQPAPAAKQAPSATAHVEEERIHMSRRRMTIAKRLVEVKNTAAMLTTFNEVDMTAIMELRKRWKEQFKERHNVGLGFMSFFTKAVVGALKDFPLLNAEIQGEDMVVKKHYDIGVAVSTESGLVVPVVRNADRLSFAAIESEIRNLAIKARDNKLSLDDLQGGTFTITNGGTFGSLMSTPILNAPQVGILGMHGILQRPVAVNGQVEIRPMMYLALSYDHRIVDGSEAVRFLVTVKKMIEDPESLLLEG
jgi:2-oxoglutarate dehydrogenase E2 component (dihydrolipoamide succinyltransferase)